MPSLIQIWANLETGSSSTVDETHDQWSYYSTALISWKGWWWDGCEEVASGRIWVWSCRLQCHRWQPKAYVKPPTSSNSTLPLLNSAAEEDKCAPLHILFVSSISLSANSFQRESKPGEILKVFLSRQELFMSCCTMLDPQLPVG